MALFKRVYKLRFPDLQLEFDELRISFEIDKDLSQETNKSKIKLYNLSPQTRRQLETPDINCRLEVGYEQNEGLKLIFVGSVARVKNQDTGTDAITELTLADGQVAIRDSVFSLSYAPGTDGRVILNGIAGQMGLLLRTGPDIEFGSYPNGFSYIGAARGALDKVCDAAGANWSVQNGELQVIMNGSSTGVRGLVFSPSSGLIGSPERIVRAAKKPDRETPKRRRRKKQKKVKPEKKAGWKIKTLLAPTVNPGDAVKTESEIITGWFRVESLKHRGDNYGGEWVSELELIEEVIYSEQHE